MPTQHIPAQIEIISSERQNQFQNMVNELLAQGYEFHGSVVYRPLHERITPEQRQLRPLERPAVPWGWAATLIRPAQEVEYDESDVPEGEA